MKLKISVTKEVLEKSKMCGRDSRNCAIATACRDIFPDAIVGQDRIYFDRSTDFIFNSKKVKDFILLFDDISPDERCEMTPFSFEIDVPNTVIDRINISEVTQLLQSHPTLSIVA